MLSQHAERDNIPKQPIITLLPHDIYTEHLQTVRNIKFTQREIEIISYILSGRSAKVISSFLSVSPKTIESHIRNIMMKVECNSRNGIINFIEKSEKFNYVKEYYLASLNQISFEKQLKEASFASQPKGSSCLIISWQENGKKDLFLSQIEKHLKIIGISCLMDIREKREFTIGILEEIGTSKEDYIICHLPMELMKELQNQEDTLKLWISNFIKKSNHNPTQFIFIMPEKVVHIINSQELQEIENINFLEQDNYYLQFFNILKILIPDIDINKYILQLQNKYETTHIFSDNVLNLPLPDTKSELKELYETNSKLQNLLLTFLKYKKYLVLTAGISLSIFLYFFLDIKNSVVTNLETKLYSDLLIPEDNALLKRPELIKQMDKVLDGKGVQTIALIGIGGAGKTTLARYYAGQQNAPMVWEIHAETQSQLLNSFEKLADAISKTEEDKRTLKDIQDIKDLKEKEDKIISFVNNRLMKIANWILIYDNVNKFIDIQKYFPEYSNIWGNGKIIITTRDSNIQNGGYIKKIHVGDLNDAQKLDLFLKITYENKADHIAVDEKQRIKRFLKEIPPFPLDISVAAYYIKTTNITYNKYLEYLKKNDQSLSTIQEELLKEYSSYTQTRYSIITLSLQHLIKTNKDFKDLLLLISFINNQNIPRSLLTAYKNDHIVDSFIHNLKKYSLIIEDNSKTNLSPSEFSIHKSTQQISRVCLSNLSESNNKSSLLKEMASFLYNYTAKLIEHDDIVGMKPVVNHLECFLYYKDLLSDFQISALIGKLGFMYVYLGNYIKARDLLESSFSLCKKNYGEQHTKTAWVMQALGITYQKLGQFELAKEILEKSILILKIQDKDNKLQFADTYGLLGCVYKSLGNYEKAKESLETALNFSKLAFQNNSRQMAGILVPLGDIYKRLGDYKKSINSLEQSLSINIKYTGKDSIYTAFTLTNLGIAYGKIGQYEKALNNLEKALEEYIKFYGRQHKETAQVLMNIGNIYRRLGIYQKAVLYFTEGNQIYKILYGNNHLETVWSAIHLANAYRLSGKPLKAVQLIEHGLKVLLKKHGENHVNTAWAYIQLGLANKDLKNYSKARALLEKSLIIYSKHYGKKHLDNAWILRGLGEVHQEQGDLTNAEKLIQAALKIECRENNPERCFSFESLADVYIKKSQVAMENENLTESEQMKANALDTLKIALKVATDNFPKDSIYIKNIKIKINHLISFSPSMYVGAVFYQPSFQFVL